MDVNRDYTNHTLRAVTLSWASVCQGIVSGALPDFRNRSEHAEKARLDFHNLEVHSRFMPRKTKE